MSAPSAADAISFCPVCRSSQRGPYLPGPGGRPDASCPNCRSLERERFFALLLDCLAPLISRPAVLVDVAPSERLTPLLRELCPQLRIGIDFDPAADGRLVDIQASVTDLPLGSDSVDMMVCYHVLEHVPDDRAAMREIARVLRPGGVAIVQVPWRSDPTTEEDPSATPEERLRRFGQADHVRFYGRDFESRMSEEGLSFHRVTPALLIGRDNCSLFHVNDYEAVWLCTPSAPDTPGSIRTALTTGSLSDAVTWMRQEMGRLQEAIEKNDRMWQSRYQRLDRHPVLRLYRRVRRPVVRARQALIRVRGRVTHTTSRTKGGKQL